MLADSLRKQMVSALNDFDMLAPNDRVMVAVSGGKDSSVLLKLFCEIKERAPFPFYFEAVMLDQKQPGFTADDYRAWVAKLGVKFTLLEQDTYSIVKEKIPEGKTYCGLCSRLRRGILYNYAATQGFTKIALGHHRDDANQTLLLNLFYAGALSSMPPKLLSDDGRNIVIRPLCYVAESDIVTYAQELQVPIIPCRLCGSQENMQRKKMKELLAEMAKVNPNVASSVLRAQANVKPSQLFDGAMWDFKGLVQKPVAESVDL